MIRPRLFPLFLLIGVCASATAIGLRTTGVTALRPAMGSSTALEATPNAIQTTVTEPSPVASLPATATAEVTIATLSTVVPPTPAPPAPTVELPVATLPAAAGRAPALDSEPDYAIGLLDRMNAARSEVGAQMLEADADLDAVALERAVDLIENGYFDHFSPSGDSAFAEMGARGIRYGIAGENLARNTYPDAKTVAAAFDGLMGSPGHRANILEGRFGYVGIAAVKSGRTWYYVTVFTD